MRKADVIVIGGGITGMMTAWNLADAGRDVVLLESGELGAQASGANAGSLHLQIQYPEFAKFGEDWARDYGPCLGFLKDSLALWQDLSRRTGEDLGVKMGGGIVVAQTGAEMALIAAKARIEAKHGVETQVLDRAALFEIAPYLSDAAIGGGYCAMEGKANTLRVTPAIQACIERAGVHILRDCAATALEAVHGGYCVTTPQGQFQAPKVVNAAGASAGKIAAMLGLQIDIDGFPLQVTATEPVAPLIPHLIYSAAGKLSLKQAPNGGCIIGGGWPAARRGDGSLATDPVSLTGNMAMAAGVVPRVGQMRALRSWTAWVNGTPDWRPILGELPGATGFYLALFPWVGFSGAPMTAKVTAELVLDQRDTASLKGVSVLAD
ncbi:FAD-binding oxidoreductase [Loktanella sp. SALINAS62]|uniref:NAD(P)/FAD-dependent oxidoreductase n=1 Tax=Loktanella sp. SALINAS62 TaxID=2706124 RepID=UPI001B8CF78F|nr:FAD-binding oxidoreductase [Loktanella sp. SALINAS62]MBS1301481.1 FAD-binding oxidoreductase [Loktanella sp. SALINAS62]